jgi:hypothetical protein
MTTVRKSLTGFGALSLIFICARIFSSTGEALEIIGVESTASLTISRPRRR